MLKEDGTVTGWMDVFNLMPKYMKLPIRGFRNPNFHSFVTTDHFNELLTARGVMHAGMSFLIAKKLVARNLLMYGSNSAGGLAGAMGLDPESKSTFLVNFIAHNKHVITILLPRLNYLFSVHFFGVQPVSSGRGLTEFRNNKINSFVDVMHRVLDPYEYIMYNHPVHAVADGTVVSIENSYNDQVGRLFEVNFGSIKPDEYLGNTIEIEHENKIRSIYGNLKRNAAVVRIGQKVRAGDMISRVGLSGKHPSPYLFFSIATPGLKIPIAGNIRVGLRAASGIWDTHFEYKLFDLANTLTDEERNENFFNYIRTDQIRYTFAPTRLVDGTLVKQLPKIEVE